MALRLSKHSDIPPFRILSVIEKVDRLRAKGIPVISFGAGQPAQGLPSEVEAVINKEAAKLLQPYTPCLGTDPLREAIANVYRQERNVDIDARHIGVVPGSSIGLQHAFHILYDPGESVMMTAPGYPAHKNLLDLLGNNVVTVQTDLSTRFQPTVAMAENAHRQTPGGLQGLVLCTPSNPTAMTSDQVAEIYAWCLANNVNLFSDEAYWLTEADGNPSETALEQGDNVVAAGTSSKFFSAPGWRIGWLASKNEDFITRLDTLAQSATISSTAMAQAVLAVALRDEFRQVFKDRITSYGDNCDVMTEGLVEAGLMTQNFADAAGKPDGAFYRFFPIDHLHPQIKSENLARAFLEHAKIRVAIAPGTDFYPPELGHLGDKMVRLTYCGAKADIEEGCEKIGEHIEEAVRMSLQY